MVNLIKSDLYRLFRSKTYKSCAIGALGVTIFVLSLAIFTDAELWIMAFTSNGVRRGFMIGLEQGAEFRDLLINALGSGAGLYIIAIVLTSTAIISRKRSGIMKATVAYGYERWKIYLSQVISLIVGISILIIIVFLSILSITCTVFKIYNIELLLIVKVLILYISVVAATVSVYGFLSTLIQNSEVISVIAIAEILGLTMLEPALSIKITSFIPYSMIRTLAQVPESVDFISYLIKVFLIIIISTFLGIIIFSKKEIK